MSRIKVVYQYYDDLLSPQWMVIKFEKGYIKDWSKTLYIPIDVPFERMFHEEFFEDQLGLAITQADLVVNPNKQGYFGIHLPSVMKRINQMRGEPLTPFFSINDFEHFVIQMSDLEELLAMDRNQIYAWR